MSEEHQLPSDSDEDDEDYVPDGAEQAGSEAESEGEIEEDSGAEDENDENEQVSKKQKKRGRKGNKSKGNKRKKIESKDVDNEDEEDKSEKKIVSEEEEKLRADSLWADFMKDTGTVSKPKPQKSSNSSQENSQIVRPKVEEKVKITKIFEFAGEEVKVEKQVAANSAEARLILSSTEKSLNQSELNNDSRKTVRRGRGGSLGGISSVLGQIGRKAKISTLEKSKLDWDNFKKQENLDEEITTHNRGKDGYLERQDFLQRADVRQFEIEKELRTVARRSTR
ncbi:craniofacial development protein 1 [Microplitis mediator]|uniref:craniofacial development protein 1 n=1 Tax=Microplitis mediator TaxID=375433 RepID=UPI00255344DA|nr:craniofacial development protein 1 [Microplitis mediator]XP_057321408.1 craniofacial development protein 1 [Microplitis mediator]